MYDMKRLGNLQTMGKLAPEAWEAFQRFDREALKDGAIPAKYKELIAVSVALTTQCPYCLELHRGRAIEAGANEREIAEAVFVAGALRAGAAITHGVHVCGDGEA
ncbi:carboxymuconolactone decarboxylase family protein [Erythrobacter sp. SN021]|uniref:carboxymuconolactone decarboxylase family protein n=1 Tax=Erythrobacter sp. SN021 TaxID=2912574 RepID=UPI001F33E6D2|nr:carboxymuconolactone decarboxylase family protein [Erythrobacter sp. SN021]MCF8882621.1 carboxymuconolactone decarboxylase family protein [Erythrobacter sp. SN021]